MICAAICGAFLPPYMVVLAKVDTPGADTFSEAPAATREAREAFATEARVMASSRIVLHAPAPVTSISPEPETVAPEVADASLREIKLKMQAAFSGLASDGGT